MDWTKVQDTVANFLVTKGFSLMGALIILILGWLLSRWGGKFIGDWLDKKKLELPVRTLLVRFVRLAVFGLTLIMAAQQLGFEVTTLVAGLGVAGVGVGLALQGPLSNMVAGLNIIFTKPFRVGEYLEVNGVAGQVVNIELTSTKLLHADKSIVTIPNRHIIGEILHNYGGIRQVSLSVGIAYNSDVALALATLKEIVAANPRILKDHAFNIGVSSLGDSSINITIAPWVNVVDFGTAQPEIYKAIIDQFRAKKIEIPFRQTEVRILNGPAGK